MHSINNGWDSTKQAETPYFVALQVRTKMREKGKRQKNKTKKMKKSNQKT